MYYKSNVREYNMKLKKSFHTLPTFHFSLLSSMVLLTSFYLLTMEDEKRHFSKFVGSICSYFMFVQVRNVSRECFKYENEPLVHFFVTNASTVLKS